jgi:hypothetical protein
MYHDDVSRYASIEAVRSDPYLQAQIESGELVPWKVDAQGHQWYRSIHASAAGNPKSFIRTTPAGQVTIFAEADDED